MADLLVVEDDPDIAVSLQELLAVSGHRVRTASDGARGLQQVAGGLPDVVLLDVEMPVMGGPAMAHRLLIEDVGRERIPLVLLSGVLDLPQVAGEVGTPYFLVKPFDAEQLLALVDRALTERTPPHPHLH